MMKRLLLTGNKLFLLVLIFSIWLLLLPVFCNVVLGQTQTQTFLTNGTYFVPAGVTQIKVECWGGGGAGGYGQGNIGAGGGGAGGSYATSVLTVVPGNSYTVTVGTQTQINLGNSNKGNGNPSWFWTSSTVYASGGYGGSGIKTSTGAGGSGPAANSIGTVKYQGGNGEDGNITPGIAGGAGGGAAGPSGAGGNGSAGTGGAGGSPNGGNGGDGVADGTDGNVGNNYGGGGSGGKSNANSKRRGGDGARGLVTVTYLLPITGTLTLCTGSTTTLFNSAPGGTWSSGNTLRATVDSSTGVVTGVSEGSVVITYTLGSGISAANLAVTATVTVYPTPTAPTLGTITQPSCSLATGSVTLAGLPASGTWTLTRLPGGVTTTGTGTSSTISSLPSGTYTFTVTNSSGCPSPASAGIVINAQPATPTSPVIGSTIQPTCASATGSVVLSGLPASGTWTVTRTPGGNTNTGTGLSATISGLSANTYTFTVTNSSGCTSFASNSFIINAQPATPSAPAVGTITQPTCAVATGSVVLSGLPSGTWTLNPGNITGSITSTTVSNLSSGTYSYTVTNSSGCTSSGSGNIVINAQPAGPPIPVQIVDCTLGFNNAVITVSSPTGSGLQYSLDGGAYQSGSSFTGVANGTHSLSVRNSLGCTTQGPNFAVNCGCVTPPTVTLSSNIGSTCGTTPITVTGNSFNNATNVTITTNGAGTVSPTSTTSAPFSFTYNPVAADAGNVVTITVTSNNPLGSPCSADYDTYALTVNPLPVAPTVGSITQPTCAVATGSVNLTGLPSVGSWTITQSPGGANYTGTGASKLISGLVPGVFTFIVTNVNGCTSPSSGNVTISSLPTAPSPPTASVTAQPNCATATGTIVVSTPVQNSGYEYSIGGAYQTGTIFAGVNPGIQIITVRRTSDNTCISNGTLVTVNSQPNPPSAPAAIVTVQPTCAVALGTIVVSNPAAGTGFEYSIDGTNYQAGVTFTGVSSGIKNITIRSTSDNSCLSPITNVTVLPQPTPPAAPVISYNAQPDCFSAIGALTFTNPIGSVVYSLDGTNYQAGSYFGNLSSGTYIATAKSTIDGTCVSPPTSATINTQPLTPSAPVVSILQPTCAVSTGTITVTSPTGTGYTYSLTGSANGSKTVTNTTGIFSNLSSDSYLLGISETTSGITCSTGGTYVTVNAVPTAPAAPTASVTLQPTCALATGTIVVSSPVQGTGYEYSIGGAYQASSTFNGMTSGAKTVTVRPTADNTCISNGTNVTVNAQPATPAAPTAVTPAATSICTGSSINLNATSSGNTIYWYTVSTGGTNIGTSASGANFSVSPTGNTTYYAESQTSAGCISNTRTATGLITVNAFPQGSLTANGPFCATGAGTLTWTATAGTGPFTVVYNDGTANRTASGVVSGTPFATFTTPVTTTTTYTLVSVTAASSCVRSTGFTGSSATITVNPLPQGSLTANGPFCATGAGTLTWTATAGTGPFTVVYNDGTANRTASGVVSGTPFATFTTPVTSNTTYTLVSVTSASSCIRSTGFTGSSATITVNPLPQGSLTANSPFCATGAGTLTWTATAGTGPFTVVYNDGTANRTASAVVSGTTFATFTTPVTATTTYTLVSVTSAGSCIRSTGFTGSSATITVNPLPQGSLTTNGPFCATGSGNLTWTATAGTGPFTIVYNDGTANRTASGVVSGTSFPTFTTPVTTTTTYTLVSVTSASSCVRSTGFTGSSATITVNPLPQGSLTANGPFCATGAGTLTWTATAGAGPFTVVYNDGTADRTASGVVSGTPFTPFTTPVTSTTTYTLVSVSSASSCVRSSGFTGSAATITVNPLPQGGLTASGPFCATGSGTLTWTATAGAGPFTVVYNDGTADRTASGVVSGTPFATFTTPVTATTTYTLVSVTSASSCVRLTGFTGSTATITVNPLPQGSLAANGPFCATGAGTLTWSATAGTGPFTVVYNDGTADRTVSGVVSGTPFATFTTPVTATTTYTLVSVTSASSCVRSTGFTGSSATITVNPLPQGSLTANGPFCATGSGTLTWTATAGTGPFTIVYNDGTANRTASGVVSGTSFATFATPVTATTTYTLVSVTSASSCVRSSGFTGSAATITVNPLPSPTFTAQPGTSVCISTDVTYTTESGQSGYLWVVPGTLNADYSIISGGTGPSSNTVTLQWLTTGNKVVTINYTNSNGCTATSYTGSIPTIVNPATSILSQSTATQTTCLTVPFNPISVTATGTGTLTYQWYSNTTANNAGGISLGSGNGANTSSYTPQSTVPGTLYYYCIVHGDCGADVTGAISGAFIVINDLVWTGTLSTDWNTIGNWSCPYLPNLTTNVLIPNVINKPILSSGPTGMSKNIVINSGSSVTVTGNTLQIAEAISNSGTFTASAGTIEMIGTAAQTIGANTFAGNTIMNLTVSNSAGVTLSGPLNLTGVMLSAIGNLDSNGNLTLVSTSAQTALIDGAGAGGVIGKVTMQRYLSKAYGYKYFSSPFSDATVSEFSNDMNLGAAFPTFYKYDENHFSPAGKEMSGWTNYTSTSGALNPLEGYAVNFGPTSSAKTVDIAGQVSNGSIKRNLSNNNRKYTKGFNLVGNPYPSPVDWDKAGWIKTNIDAGISFFNASTPSGSSAVNDTLQYQGVYTSYVNGITTGSFDNIIGSMQGFFVHVSDGGYPVNGMLGATNAVRTLDHNPTFKRTMVDDRTILRFSANFETNNSNEDAAVIYFDNNVIPGFDKEMDAIKMTNTDVRVPNIYLLKQETKQLSIYGMQQPTDSITRIPMGISVQSDGLINFNAKDITRLPSFLFIYLIDKEFGITQDLKLTPQYRFNLKAGEYQQRFQLVFATESIIKPLAPVEKMFKISRSATMVILQSNLPFNTKGSMIVSNMNGQIILHREVYEHETVEFNPSYSSGVYIITVISGSKKESEKILIRKDYE